MVGVEGDLGRKIGEGFGGRFSGSVVVVRRGQLRCHVRSPRWIASVSAVMLAAVVFPVWLERILWRSQGCVVQL